ncbi:MULTISPECIES: SpoIIE family protein phosphatase [unclassified Streptomyces]|uniref:SpoIIE family protein phosphatase n=1 Tax=unclassified Streptomyces TaxID=2593676 RepID=UPI002E328638|nr:SpoIIE family protein phosphatase [Streptomyces sp. NBC_01462]
MPRTSPRWWVRPASTLSTNRSPGRAPWHGPGIPHPRSLVRRVRSPSPTSPQEPLGIGVGVPFEAVELELPEGSLLALHTDGLIEAGVHDIDVGMLRLGSALAQPGCSLEELCTSATEPRSPTRRTMSVAPGTWRPVS